MPAMDSPLRKTAKSLARSHRQVEPNLRRVIFYPDPEEREVRLLEVVAGSPNVGEVHPFRFAPDEGHDVPFPMVLIELSPQEFTRLKRKELQLPAGWNQGEELFKA